MESMENFEKCSEWTSGINLELVFSNVLRPNPVDNTGSRHMYAPDFGYVCVFSQITFLECLAEVSEVSYCMCFVWVEMEHAPSSLEANLLTLGLRPACISLPNSHHTVTESLKYI